MANNSEEKGFLEEIASALSSVIVVLIVGLIICAIAGFIEYFIVTKIIYGQYTRNEQKKGLYDLQGINSFIIKLRIWLCFSLASIILLPMAFFIGNDMPWVIVLLIVMGLTMAVLCHMALDKVLGAMYEEKFKNF